MDQVLNGRDSLVVMATGGGKSMWYVILCNSCLVILF